MASIISAPIMSVRVAIVWCCVLAGIFSSCQTRYFVLPDLSEAVSTNKCDSTFENLDYTKYVLNMRQLTYFKNNVEETALMTDFSKLHSHLVFFNDLNKIRPKKFHRIEAWAANSPGKNKVDSLFTGQPIAIISAKGKKLDGDSMAYELIHIYYGKIIVDSFLVNNHLKIRKAFKAEKRVTVTGKNTRLNFEETTRNMNLTVYLSTEQVRHESGLLDCMEIQALLDRNHNQIGAEKAMIFGFEQIYGEPLWLIKQTKHVDMPEYHGTLEKVKK